MQDIVVKMLLVSLNSWLMTQDLKKLADSGVDELEEYITEKVPATYKAEVLALILTIRNGIGIPDYPDK